MTKTTKEEIIDMSRYIESEEIVEQCVGCSKVFDYVPAGGMVASQKCRAYIKPSVKWEQKPVAVSPVLVRSKEHPKGILQDLPVTEFRCPLADHLSVAAVAKTKVNPLKASKRGGR